MRNRERIVISNSIGECAPVTATRCWSAGSGAAYACIAVFLLWWLLLIPAAVRGDDSAPLNLINATESDNGSSVTLHSGEGLSVSLAITTGTGYSWRVARIDGKVLREDSRPTLVQSSHPIPGATATQVFRFMVAGLGKTQLELDYVRPWEKGVAPARTFRLDVTVS
jgi:inhibitor of cysteine peptidase